MFKHLLSLALCTRCVELQCQKQADTLSILSPTMARTAGIEPASHIAYARLYLTAQSSDTPQTFDLSNPTLTVQCTQRPTGTFLFEMFLNEGGITDTSFYPPWRPASSTDLFPPTTEKVKVTMEFLGYTKVKPVTRQFELVTDPPGQMRYNPPSSGSSNMEEIAFYFRYLRALPTLRVTHKDHTDTYLTAPLLDQIRKEPSCRASAL